VLELGAVVIPVMPARDLVALAVGAENAGVDHLLVADEGLMPDVYVALGAAAAATDRIRLGPVTNGYTRHPAVTAAAVATLDEASDGRAIAALVAGGSAVLDPMRIPRRSPVEIVDETIEVMRRLWSGESVTWTGRHHRLDGARLSTGRREIPVWVAARGPRMLALAGRRADGVVMEVKSDLPQAIELASAAERSDRPRRIYLDRLAYRPELETEGASSVFVQVLVDSPDRQLRALGLSSAEIEQLRSTYHDAGSAAAAALVTTSIIHAHQIVGQPDECSRILGRLTQEHELDVFLVYAKNRDLNENLTMLREVRSIVDDANSLVL